MRRKQIWAVAALLSLTPISGSAQTKEFNSKEASEYCKRVSNISQGSAERVASVMEVSVSSVKLLRAQASAFGGCLVVFDTPKGPVDRSCSTVYSDGRTFWVGGHCF